MRKLLAGAAVAAVIGSATLAFAATASGEIKSIDTSHHSITLTDNKAYDVAANVNLTGLKAGERVNITYQEQNGKMMASAVTVVR